MTCGKVRSFWRIWLVKVSRSSISTWYVRSIWDI